MAKIIGVISIKGGVGKTSVASSLGASLANELGKRVLVVDANFTAPNLGLHLGIINPEITIHNALDNSGGFSMADAIYSTEYGFDVITGALVHEKKINALRLPEKLRELKRKYDFIIIDSSPNLNEELASVMAASDELLVVTTPDHVTLSTTIRAVRTAKEKRTPIIGLVLNKVYGKKFELKIEDIEKIAGCPVLAVIPHETEMLKSLSKCLPSTLHDNKTDASIEFSNLAASLAGELSKRKKWLDGFLRTLLGEKVPLEEINRDVLVNERRGNPFYS